MRARNMIVISFDQKFPITSWIINLLKVSHHYNKLRKSMTLLDQALRQNYGVTLKFHVAWPLNYRAYLKKFA